MKFSRTLIATALVLGVTESILVGQAPDTRQLANRMDSVEEAVRALSKEVADLSTLLRAALPRPTIADIPAFELNLANATVKGFATARIVLIEYTDFECPFCARHAQAAYRDIQREFVETGKIRYAVRNLPLEALHPRALKAAEAAECAGAQGKYWEMHDSLFANQQALAVSGLMNLAKVLTLDLDTFQSCLTEGKMTAKVNEDLAEAKRLGLTATPAFLIGEVNVDGGVRVIQGITGAQPFEVFRTAFQRLLAKRETSTVK